MEARVPLDSKISSVRGRTIETRPINGTRPRGATPADDDRLAAELAEPLTQSGSMAEAKQREHRVIMAEARTRDAQESGLLAFGEGPWAAARRGGA